MQSTDNIDYKKNEIKAGLYIVSTPIGNLDDLTVRALTVLKSSDYILCEDTKRSRKLLNHYNLKKKLISYHKFNEKKKLDYVIHLIKKNKVISLISDAGTPTISDPGILLIKRCIIEKLKIIPIPGPSAVTTAMSISGFEDKYIFYGFLPKSENEINKTLKSLSILNYSIVFFIPAQKINFFLKFFRDFFSDREILIAKEITKFYEEMIRDTVLSVKDFSPIFKGELTVVLSKPKKEKKDMNKIGESVKNDIKKMVKKYSIKDVVDFFSKKENLSKKAIYSLCLKMKNLK